MRKLIFLLTTFFAISHFANAQGESLANIPIDTNAMLINQWKVIEQQYPIGNISTHNKLIEDYQKLSQEYGFRFEKEYSNERLFFSYQHIFDELAILEDKDGNLDVETISLPEYQNRFERNYSDKNINRDLVDIFPIPEDYNVQSIYWLKFDAVNQSDVAEEAWFMVGWIERSWNHIEVFRDDGVSIQKVGESGLRTPTSQKMVDDWRNLIQIKVPPQSRYTYYLRLDGVFFPKYPDRIALYHYDEKEYWQQKNSHQFQDGVFLGMTFLLLLIVGVLFYYEREKDTFFFGIQLIGTWLHFFADTENIGSSNFILELFPGALEIGQVLAIIGFIMMILGGIFFPIAFIKAEEHAPKMKKWLTRSFFVTAGLYLFLGIFNIFLHPYFEYPQLFGWIPYYIFIFFGFLSIIPISIIVMCIVAWNKKYPLAKIFIIGYLPLAISIFFGLIGATVFEYSLSSNQFDLALRIGHLATYFLFTIAIFYKRQEEKNEILNKRIELSLRLNEEQQEANRLKELDSFKSKLYTNLTHEFRTPLTVILGMVGQIRNEPKKYLDEGTRLIEANGKNLLRLINQLLDLSKLENKSFQLKMQQSDIIPYLRYITESFQSYANGKNLSLRFFSPLESLVMDYDVEQIKQIMTNLISNALKFTPSGGEITIRVNLIDNQLIIEIKDTGIGIAEKDLPNIFDRFFQVDGSTTRERGGTGIGLAHTQELIHLMDGTIRVSSSLGQGTTFVVSLSSRRILPNRLHIKEDIIQPKETQTPIPINNFLSDDKKSKETIRENRATVLLIEDNPDVVVYLKTCLASFYEIEVAYNGKIGIDKAIEIIPDLIISDVMMPQKDGYEVCDFLKNDERTSHIPIILLTAKADVSSKIIGLKRGADAYLSKPFDKEELLVRLKSLIARQDRLVKYFSRKNHIVESVPLQKEEVEEDIQIEDIFIQKVKKIIEENYSDENFALPQLCQKLRMSRSQLFRKLKALVGTSPSEFIRKYRLEKAKFLLETTDKNVSEVSWAVGYKDVSHFSKSFQGEFGYLPSMKLK